MNSLFELVDKQKTRADQIFTAFKKFHYKHPEVWNLFAKYAQDAIRSGQKNYSAKAIIERIRWHITIDNNNDDVKLNNNFTAYYGRMFHAAHPQHDGFFRNRMRKSTEESARDVDVQVFIDDKPTNEEDLTKELIEMSKARN